MTNKVDRILKIFNKVCNILKRHPKSLPDYDQVYCSILKRCSFQEKFSFSLLCIFFCMQYTLPISLVALGSITASRETLATFINQNNNNKDQEQAERTVTKILFILGVITILLGVINTTVRPAESYDTSAKFNNRLAKFEIELKLHLYKLIESKANSDDVIKFLETKNNELWEIIDKYNEARSLRPREAMNSVVNEKMSQTTELENNSVPESINNKKSGG